MYLIHTLLFLFCIHISFPYTFDTLSKMLTQNDLRSWISNQTKVLDNKNPYCHLCCIKISATTIGKKCGEHTMCKYKPDKVGKACKGYIPVKFTLNEQQVLVDAHNTLRNIVANGDEKRGSRGPQPPASNMRAMEWNHELAMVAERWAAQCIYANDICRDLERFPVGQNIAMGNLANSNELQFIKRWYDQVERFNRAEVEQFTLPENGYHPAGRYTQIIWADTYQLGCARAIFQQTKGSELSYREHFICNYGPSGNIPNQPVYEIGPTCSRCEEGTGCTLDYPALCSGQVVHRLPIEKYVEPTKQKEVSTSKAHTKLKSNFVIFILINLYCIIQ